MYTVSEKIQAARQKYQLSLSQFGKLVGVPGSTVMRWEEGVEPRDANRLQIVLVINLLLDPEMVYSELGRQGIRIDKKHWDSFAALIKGIEDSNTVSAEAKIALPENKGFTIVRAVSGLMLLIAQHYLPRIPLGKIGKVTKLLSELL
jgi:transcriptional regulator with XRE-family HTH domain